MLSLIHKSTNPQSLPGPRGSCTDPKCKFAHSTSELRHQPDLTKAPAHGELRQL